MKFQKILVGLFLLSSTLLTQGMCNFGSFARVPGSPFAAGNTPENLAFSPIVSGNLFAAVPNVSSNNVSVYKVTQSNGVFTPVGSPFLTGVNPYGIAFSPIVAGNLFAATSNYGDNTISIYSVNQTTGAFTQIPTSPTNGGNGPYIIAFSPVISGNLFAAVTDYNDGTVGVYSVNQTTGNFTLIGSFAAGSGPNAVAFSPIINGNLFAAVANGNDNTVSIYSVNPISGVFNQLLDSPFPTGESPIGVAFSPILDGKLFMGVSSYTDGNVSIYSIDPATGEPTQVPGSPFAAGECAYWVAFSPVVSNTVIVGVANSCDNDVSVYTMDPVSGALTQVPGSPFAAGLDAFIISFSTIASGNLFAGVVSDQSNSVSVFKVCLALPPANLKGCKGADIFLLQEENLINILTWTAPVSVTSPVSYSIYRDAGLTQLVATVPGTQLQFVDHNRMANVVYTYYIVANYADGSISVPASVTVTDNCVLNKN